MKKLLKSVFTGIAIISKPTKTIDSKLNTPFPKHVSESCPNFKLVYFQLFELKSVEKHYD